MDGSFVQLRGPIHLNGGSFLQLGGPMQIDGVICAIIEVPCM